MHELGAVVSPVSLVIDLSVARNLALFEITGDFILAIDATDGTANCDVRLVSPASDAISFRIGRKLQLRGDLVFRRFYVSNTAQGARTITLLIGNPESVEMTTPGSVQIAGTVVVDLSALTTRLAPVEILVTAAAEILLADLTAALSSKSVLIVQNLGPNAIFYAFNLDPGTGPGVTTANGISLPAGQTVLLDDVGGLAMWARTSVLQIAGAGTRVGGGRR